MKVDVPLLNRNAAFSSALTCDRFGKPFVSRRVLAHFLKIKNAFALNLSSSKREHLAWFWEHTQETGTEGISAVIVHPQTC